MSLDSSKTSYWTKLILKIDILMLVYEVWLDKIKASVMRYHVKGQERGSHAALPVDKLAILQSTAPNAGSQALIHCLKNHISLADLISRIPVIINNEIIIAVCHSKIDVN